MDDKLIKKIFGTMDRDSLTALTIALLAVVFLIWVTISVSRKGETGQPSGVVGVAEDYVQAPLADEEETPPAPAENSVKPANQVRGSSAPAVVAKDEQPKAVRFDGEVLAGRVSKVYDFNESDYKRALEADKTVVLFFYAKWCPICQREVAYSFYPAFNSLGDINTVGFRVNYNDSDTDKFEEELAREFGVAYQHTKVIIKGGQRVVKSPEEWSEDRYLQELSNLK